MPDSFLTFAGRSTLEFGVGISGEGTYAKPQRRITTFTIPGRNGVLTQDEGTFENVQITYPAYIVRGFEHRFDDFMAYMLSFSGYQRLEDTYHANCFRKALFAGPVEPKTGVLNHNGQFELTFDCMPERWLASGERKITYVRSGRGLALRNPTFYPSKPLIRLYGEGDVVFIGADDETIKHYIIVRSAPDAGYTDLDCETGMAYAGEENRSAYVDWGSNPLLPLPELSPGYNRIVVNAPGEKIEVTPRWWTI